MTFEGLRGYAQAANDLSSIARARLLEAAREAVRGEVERRGVALGLASAEEVATLRRTVDRLQRRVVELERAAAPVAPATTPAGGKPEAAAAPRATADRPARRPSAARSRATGRAPVGGRPPAGAAPHNTRPAPAPSSPDPAPATPAPDGTAPEAPADASEAPSASAKVTPVRRPRRTAATDGPKSGDSDSKGSDPKSDGQNSGGRP